VSRGLMRKTTHFWRVVESNPSTALTPTSGKVVRAEVSTAWKAWSRSGRSPGPHRARRGGHLGRVDGSRRAPGGRLISLGRGPVERTRPSAAISAGLVDDLAKLVGDQNGHGGLRFPGGLGTVK
jgi:hypothetical protein